MSGIPFYTDVVVKLLSEIDELLNEYVFHAYSAISSYLTIPLGTLAIIYIALLGYAIMSGWIRMTMGELLKSVIKISLIYMAVTQWGWVSKNFIELINSTINGIGDVLISAAPSHIPGADGIDGAMQIVLIEFTKLGAVLFQSGGMTNIGGLIDGAILWLFSYILIAVALFELIISKVLLAILFVFTPLMALFYFFKKFQGITDRWLGMIIGAALLQLFVIASLTLSLSLAYWWLELHVGEDALQIGNYGTLPVIIIGIVCIGLILKSASIAMYIGSAISRNGTGNFSAAAAGAIFGNWASNIKNRANGRILYNKQTQSSPSNTSSASQTNSLRSGD
jgi:type IV secretion system protein VirB6